MLIACIILAICLVMALTTFRSIKSSYRIQYISAYILLGAFASLAQAFHTGPWAAAAGLFAILSAMCLAIIRFKFNA